MRTEAIATALAGVGLLVPSSLGLLVTGIPTPVCPFPLLTTLPAFLLSGWSAENAAILLPAVLFFLWNRQLFRGAARVPPRSYALAAIASILSVVYLAIGWRFGLAYQGREYTRFVCIVNAVCIATLVLCFAWAYRAQTSFRTSLVLHWALFAWLSWYAFPWLGELP